MTPETILEQSNRAHLPKECGWTSYSRDSSSLASEVFKNDPDLTGRVANYIGLVVNKGFHQLKLEEADKELKDLPLLLVQYSQSYYGWESSTVLMVQETVKSDEFTAKALHRISLFNKATPRREQNHLFVPDFRFELDDDDIDGKERYAAIFKAAVEVPEGNVFGAILPRQTTDAQLMQLRASQPAAYFEPATS